MTLIYKSETTIKAVSKDRPKSLIFRISGVLRELTEFEDNTTATVEIHKNSDETKYIKIYKKKD